MTPSKYAFTLGFDVEFLLLKSTGVKSVPVFAPEVFPQFPKEAPCVSEGGFRYHYDNIWFELATPVYFSSAYKAPCHLGLFAQDIQEYAHHIIKQEHDFLTPVANMSSIKITAADEDACPELLVFGCNPDYNAYTKDVNPAPSAEMARGLRTSGGHIHFGFVNPKEAGFDPSNLEHYYALVKAFDCFVGLPLKRMNLLNEERQNLYGKAGAFRFKTDYPGIEYRVPSSDWVAQQNTTLLSRANLSACARMWSFFLREDAQSLCEDVADFINTPSRMVLKKRGEILDNYLRTMV